MSDILGCFVTVIGTLPAWGLILGFYCVSWGERVCMYLEYIMYRNRLKQVKTVFSQKVLQKLSPVRLILIGIIISDISNRNNL